MGKRRRTVEAMLRNENDACAHAVRRTPLALRKSVSRAKDTYPAWEVSDGERTICVVRGKIIIERHNPLKEKPAGG